MMTHCPALRRALAVLATAFGLSALAVLSPGDRADADGCRDLEIDRDFPDPDVLLVDGTYFVYATNIVGADNVQLVRSRDLDRWEFLPDALPQLPAWAAPNMTWAPEVAVRPDGAGYVMYFTARHKASGRQCIGVATSETPQGPFAPVDGEPLICPLHQGGAIDASTFRDSDGSFFVLWKNDGNCCGLDTWIHIQRTSADGLRLEGDPIRLIKQTQDWEGNLVEAPTLWEEDGWYYLFYSANYYGGDDYATGYARADDLFGPYEKASKPLLSSTDEPEPIIGPGGQDVVRTDDGTRLIYHSWPSDFVEQGADPDTSYRGIRIDRLDWVKGNPVVIPTC
jgi:arabinan endo-1,5-alpha-L-arabinosidase